MIGEIGYETQRIEWNGSFCILSSSRTRNEKLSVNMNDSQIATKSTSKAMKRQVELDQNGIIEMNWRHQLKIKSNKYSEYE